MDTATNVKRLMKIDSLIKKGLSDEIVIMQSIYLELAHSLKLIKEAIVPADFKNPKGTAHIKSAVNAFISEISSFNSLQGRFYDVKERAAELREKLEQYRDNLDVYANSKEAGKEFDNNIVYDFKVKIRRRFEQDIEFNKQVEQSLS
ncbi:hypothetical protein KY332_00415 [Candidatus Woesearchaeota archaeon]|nr:hypothetical protein [Candidatus Woesearchaeota archaeon]